MQENSESSESSESSEQTKKFNLKELRVQILSMSKQDAMDYILGDEWYRTPRPFQFAIQVRAGANLPGILEMYIRSSISNLGQIEKIFNQSEKKIAELLGVKASAVHMAAHDLKEFGIVRKGKNGERKREWAIEEPKEKAKEESDPDKEANRSDPVKELCVTQSKNFDPPSQETLTDPVKELCPHNNRKDLKKKEKNKKEDKEESIPSFSGDSSFKKEDKDKAKARGYLNDFVLLNPMEFCKSYFGLLKMFKKGNLTEGELDSVIAPECLNKVPQEFRRQDIIAEWMIWFVLTPHRPKGSLYLSYFKKSWEDFSPIAIDLLETITAPERQQREAEAKARQERQDREDKARQERQDREDEKERRLLDEEIRQSLEKKKAAAEAKRQKEIQEEEARKKMAIEEEEKREREIEKFQKSLPSLESIRLSVNTVLTPENWLDNYYGYQNFMEAMFRSISVLRLTCGTDNKMYHYPYLARDSFGGDHGAYEQKSREFVLAEAERIIDELKAHGVSAAPISPISWRRFAQFFGIDPKAEFVRPKLPVTTNGDEDFESPFSDD